MADQLQLRGGTTSEHSTFTGALREVTVDTDKDVLVVHDNSTAGGHPLMAEDGSNSALALGSAGTPSLKFTGDANTGIYSPTADTVGVSTGGTERLRITSDGKVGIGTSSPAKALHVNGDIRLPTDYTISWGDDACRIFRATNDLRIDVGSSERLRIDSSGRVGIGVTAPATALHLGNSSTLRINNTDGTRSLDLFNDVTNAEIKASVDPIRLNAFHSTAYIRFDTNNTERARIDSSGRLLVGTSSTSSNSKARFVSGVSGAAASVDFASSASSGISDGSGLGYLFFTDNSATPNQGALIAAEGDSAWTHGTSHPSRLVFSTCASGASSPTERMRINSQGTVSISGYGDSDSNYYLIAGTASVDTKAALKCIAATTASRTQIGFANPNGFVGTISTTASTTTYATSSDYRLKENVVPLTGAADRVKQLKPSQFNFIVDPDKTVDGFIAHEAQAVVPECVTGEKDAVDDEGNPVYQGIDQSKLVPLLTAALQEAIAKIETLEQRLSDAGIA